MSEDLVSEFLEACGEGDFVRYTFWQSNLQACFSKSYLGAGVSEYTFADLGEVVGVSYRGAKDDYLAKYEFIVSVLCKFVFRSNSEKGIRSYVQRMLVLDAMFRSTDRHLSNFGVKRGSTGIFFLLPLYDFGLSLGGEDPYYWDLSNLLKGWGVKVKSLECGVVTIEKHFSYQSRYDVYRFVGIHDNRVTVGFRQFVLFLRLLCKYFPKDFYGNGTKQVLESAFGKFDRLRF